VLITELTENINGTYVRVQQGFKLATFAKTLGAI
jgi:hypothetical protein